MTTCISNASEKKVCITKPHNPLGFILWTLAILKVYKLGLTSSMYMHEIFQSKTLLFVVSVYMAFEKISQRNLSNCLSARKLFISGFITIKTYTILLLGSQTCVLKATDSCVTLHICVT